MFSNHTGSRNLRLWLGIALGALCVVQFAAIVRWQGHSFGVSPASAQEAALTTDEEVANYAKTVVEIEPLRKVAYGKASDVLVEAGSEISLEDSSMSCLNSNLSDMPEMGKSEKVSLLTALVDYCNEAQTIAEDNGLTPQQFNSITAAHREDPAIARRIQSAMSNAKTGETVESK